MGDFKLESHIEKQPNKLAQSNTNNSPIAKTETENKVTSSNSSESIQKISNLENSPYPEYMKDIVFTLSNNPRYSLDKDSMRKTADYIDSKFRELGFHKNNSSASVDFGTLKHQKFNLDKERILNPFHELPKHLIKFENLFHEVIPESAENILVSFGSKKADAKVVVIGGHYDTDSSAVTKAFNESKLFIREYHLKNNPGLNPEKEQYDLKRSNELLAIDPKLREALKENIEQNLKAKEVYKPEIQQEINRLEDLIKLPQFNRGADDNASAVAGVLTTAKYLSSDKKLIESLAAKNIRVECVTYANEEAPYFNINGMGSQFHAKRLKESGAKAEAIIYEMLGYYSDEPNSQKYPAKFLERFYPKKGNFIGVVGNLFPGSIKLARSIKKNVEKNTSLPAEWLAFSEKLLPELGLSDHKPYWDQGIRAVMVTDTSFNRNKHYHVGGDDPEKLDYEKMAEVIKGIYAYMKESL